MESFSLSIALYKFSSFLRPATTTKGMKHFVGKEACPAPKHLMSDFFLLCAMIVCISMYTLSSASPSSDYYLAGKRPSADLSHLLSTYHYLEYETIYAFYRKTLWRREYRRCRDPASSFCSAHFFVLNGI